MPRSIPDQLLSRVALSNLQLRRAPENPLSRRLWTGLSSLRPNSPASTGMKVGRMEALMRKSSLSESCEKKGEFPADFSVLP